MPSTTYSIEMDTATAAAIAIGKEYLSGAVTRDTTTGVITRHLPLSSPIPNTSAVGPSLLTISKRLGSTSNTTIVFSLGVLAGGILARTAAHMKRDRHLHTQEHPGDGTHTTPETIDGRPDPRDHTIPSRTRDSDAPGQPDELPPAPPTSTDSTSSPRHRVARLAPTAGPDAAAA